MHMRSQSVSHILHPQQCMGIAKRTSLRHIPNPHWARNWSVFLSLKDYISYMQVSTITHDIVHYIFAHRRILDFQSVLNEHTNTIALPPQVLMTVLYAHSRVESIQNFCLSPTFTQFDEFCRYLGISGCQHRPIQWLWDTQLVTSSI